MRKVPWDYVIKVLLVSRIPEEANGSRMLVVTGMAGCGKTQLMLKFMKTHEAE